MFYHQICKTFAVNQDGFVLYLADKFVNTIGKTNLYIIIKKLLLGILETYEKITDSISNFRTTFPRMIGSNYLLPANICGAKGILWQHDFLERKRNFYYRLRNDDLYLTFIQFGYIGRKDISIAILPSATPVAFNFASIFFKNVERRDCIMSTVNFDVKTGALDTFDLEM